MSESDKDEIKIIGTRVTRFNEAGEPDYVQTILYPQKEVTVSNYWGKPVLKIELIRSTEGDSIENI